MKCFALIAVLCCFGVCAGDSLSLDFLNQNLLNPMLDQIYQNAINMLGAQITTILGSLFGKRAASDALNVNLAQVILPFVGKVKEIYQRLFTVFLQITQNLEQWVEKAGWARTEILRAGADAEAAVAGLNLKVEFLQPLVGLVQQHLAGLIPGLQGIIANALDAAKHPIQSLIGTGNLLQP